MANFITVNKIEQYAQGLLISRVAVKKLDDFADKSLVSSVKTVLPNAKAVIATCLTYNDGSASGNILQYTRANYYRVLSKMLHKLAKLIKAQIGDTRADSEVFRTSVNSQLNDKSLAVACGLGTFCANHIIGVEGIGVKTILGELIVDIDCRGECCEPRKICTDCGACFNACPTGALQADGVDKSVCIQHNSGIVDFNKELIDVWGTRFFGCSACSECCPLNKNSPTSSLETQNLTGYIGNNFDFNNLFVFKKGDYKKAFRANQLSATWVDEIVHPRNILTALYNGGQTNKIVKYKEQIDNYGWTTEEKNYLISWCDILLNKEQK